MVEFFACICQWYTDITFKSYIYKTLFGFYFATISF